MARPVLGRRQGGPPEADTRWRTPRDSRGEFGWDVGPRRMGRASPRLGRMDGPMESDPWRSQR